MCRLEAGSLALLLLLALGVTAGAGTADPAAGGSPSAAPAQVESDHVEFRITVYENASARWTLTYTLIFANETERETFESFADEFNENDTRTYRNFRGQARSLAAAGRNSTDREMEALAFDRRAFVGGDCVADTDCGTVRMSFVWTAFAREDGDRIVVDDVFESGLYLSSAQDLVFEAGPALRFVEARPDSYTPSGTSLETSTSITYQGEQIFSDNRPRVVYAPEEPATDLSTPTVTSTPGPDVQRTDLPVMVFAGLFVLAVGIGLAVVWRRSGAATLSPLGFGDGGAGAEDGGAMVGDPTVSDADLLSDEDRVLTLLRENGGRMKQVDIVEETGWSKSKVSMLLSEMEDEGEISKLRVGRENIISLSGHEPDAAGSPHDG